MRYHVYSWSTVDDLLALAAAELAGAEEDGESTPRSVAEALRLAEILTEIIETQAAVQAMPRAAAIQELRRQLRQAAEEKPASRPLTNREVKAMFAAVDEAESNRAWREAERKGSS